MTRYFIPKTSATTPTSDHPQRLTVYAYRDDAPTTPIRSHYDEVQIVPADAIVIERDELPEVQAHRSMPNSIEAGAVFLRFDVEIDPAKHAASRVRDWAAIAAYLREHPPVDEAQVEALTRLLHEPYPDCGTWEQNEAIARRLVERGVRVERADR